MSFFLPLFKFTSASLNTILKYGIHSATFQVASSSIFQKYTCSVFLLFILDLEMFALQVQNKSASNPSLFLIVRAVLLNLSFFSVRMNLVHSCIVGIPIFPQICFFMNGVKKSNKVSIALIFYCSLKISRLHQREH